jgi:hypothetical protein
MTSNAWATPVCTNSGNSKIVPLAFRQDFINMYILYTTARFARMLKLASLLWDVHPMSQTFFLDPGSI